MLTGVAVGPRPALQARLVAVVVALVVAEEVVARAAELVAAEAVVVLVADEADLEVELGRGAVVLQALPLTAGVDHPRVDGSLDQRRANTCRHEALGRSHSRDRDSGLRLGKTN